MIDSLNKMSRLSSKNKKKLHDQETIVLDSLNSFNFNQLLELDARTLNDLIKTAYENKYHFKYNDDLAKSPQISKIQNEILDSIKKRCLLEVNKKKTISFCPTLDEKEIVRRQKQVQESKDFFSKLSPEQLESIKQLLIQKKQPVKLNPQQDVTYMCDEDEIYLALKDKLPPEFKLTIISHLNGLRNYLDLPQIRYLYTTDSKFVSDLEAHDNIEAVRYEKELFVMFPELFVAEFTKNQAFLKAVLDLTEFISQPEELVQNITQILGELDKINYSTQKVFSLSDLEEFVEMCQVKFEEKLANLNITGMDLLKILRTNQKNTVIDHKLVELELEVRKTDEDKSRFVDFSVYPLALNKEKVERLQKEHQTEQEKLKYQRAISFYETNNEHLSLISVCQTILEDLDFKLALGQSFSRHQKPVVKKSGRFKFTKLKSRSFTENNLDVVPITYHLDTAQTILSGANSGGKTSLLNLITETHLLAMMGLFVEGEAEVPLYQEMYYFKKSSGTAGSGAFESTLKSFAEINADPKSRTLVLADEIESITEPGAASRIISATLSWLAKSGQKDIVLVSHLGETLQKVCPEARVDGIEAKYLDDELNLVVERNPRLNYLAKSTPQLIVERLAKKNNTEYFNYLHQQLGDV